jgi:hypothetical protein
MGCAIIVWAKYAHTHSRAADHSLHAAQANRNSLSGNGTADTEPVTGPYDELV